MKALGRRLAGVLACLAAAGTPRAVAAQSTHVLIVSGLSGDPAFKTRFGSAVSAVRSAAATRWGVSDSSL
ncbi:MAG: hypothetical protein ACK5U0_12020, partial [Gemmatimonas sp.]